ncbi:hypothetical protein HMPREF9078_01584 [Capnocytophaga sp. oral taxon 380 str. F0488]|nr:hypothetical protein HMPREF9078_01584 [Capnocytophaga sp. oral taxon 380 str. F0488]
MSCYDCSSCYNCPCGSHLPVWLAPVCVARTCLPLINRIQ